MLKSLTKVIVITALTSTAVSQELLPIVGHSSVVRSVAFSADGKLLASASIDNTVKLWDIENKRLLKVIRDVPRRYPNSIAFTPDNQFLIIANAFNPVRVYSTATYQIVSTIQFAAIISTIKVSPDSRLLAVGKQDGSITLWNLVTSDSIKTLKNQNYNVLSIDFSPSNKYIAVSGNQIDIWDIESFRNVKTITIDNDDKANHHINTVRFLNEHQLLAIEGIHFYKWDLNDSLESTVFDFQKHKRYPGRIFALSPDRKFVATFPGVSWNASGDSKHEIQLWDASNFSLVASLEIDANRGEAAMDWSDDDETIAMGYGSGQITIVKVVKKTDSSIIQEHFKIEPQYSVESVLSIDSKNLVVANYSNAYIDNYLPKGIIIWNIATAEPVMRLKEHRDRISSVCYAPRRDILFSGSHDQTIKMWNLNESKSLHTFLGHTGRVNSLECSPNEKVLASIDSDNRLIIWDIDNRKISNEVSLSAFVSDLKFSSDGKKVIAVRPNEQMIEILDVSSLQMLSTIKVEQYLSEIHTLPNSAFLIAPGLKDKFGIWNIETGGLRTSYHNLRHTSHFSLSETGELMFSASENSINIRDTFSGNRRGLVQTEHQRITSLAFNNLKEYLIVGDESGKVQLMSLDGQLFLSFLALPDDNWLAFTSDNSFIGSKNAVDHVGVLFGNSLSYGDNNLELVRSFNNPNKVHSFLGKREEKAFFEKSRLLTVILPLAIALMIPVLIYVYKMRISVSKYQKQATTKKAQTTKTNKRDVFLSHATEDKRRYVIPLAKALKRKGISYWLDNAEIKWGDNITEKINEGIASSTFVIVFISSSFLKKRWPKAELNTALTLENNRNQKVVLPLLVENNRTLLEQYSLILPKLYLSWDIGANKIANALKELIETKQ